MAACLRGASRLGNPNCLLNKLLLGVQISWSVTNQLLRTGQILRRSYAAGSRPNLKTQQNTKFDHVPVVHINATYNNTMFTVTDHKGNTVAWTSAGTEGFKNSKRGSSVAAQQAGVAAAKKAIDFGIRRVRVKIKGIGTGRQKGIDFGIRRVRIKIKGIDPGRQNSIRGLQNGGLSVVSITDVTPVPHNGCRPRKVRRF